MATYSESQQRDLDIRSGEDLDKQAMYATISWKKNGRQGSWKVANAARARQFIAHLQKSGATNIEQTLL